jgi:hypothetical protein
MGIKATKPQTIWLPKLLIIPLAFVCLTISTALTYSENIQLNVWNIYLFYFTVGAVVGGLIFRNASLIFDRSSNSVTLPGGYAIFIFLLGIFLLNYFWGYMKILCPTLTTLQLIHFKIAISSVLSGLFVVRCATYLFKFFKSI